MAFSLILMNDSGIIRVCIIPYQYHQFLSTKYFYSFVNGSFNLTKVGTTKSQMSMKKKWSSINYVKSHSLYSLIHTLLCLFESFLVNALSYFTLKFEASLEIIQKQSCMNFIIFRIYKEALLPYLPDDLLNQNSKSSYRYNFPRSYLIELKYYTL